MKVDRDELLLYTLGQLSPERSAAIEAVLKSDPALQAEVSADQDALGLLLDELDLQTVTVPAESQERLLARVRAEAAAPPLPLQLPARPVWRWALLLGIAASLALFFTFRGPADPAQQYVSTAGAITEIVKVNGQDFGKLVRLPDGRVFIHLNRAASKGSTYQLWQIQAGQPVSLGVFDQGGLLTRPLAADITLAVSVEPLGGSPQPTTKPLFAQRL